MSFVVLFLAAANCRPEAPPTSKALLSALGGDLTRSVPKLGRCDPNTVVRFAIEPDGSVDDFAVSAPGKTKNTCAEEAKSVRYPPLAEGLSVRGHTMLRTLASRGSKREKHGGLSQDAIKAVLDEAKPKFRRCYEHELSEHPDLSTRIVLYFVIDKDGEVARAFSLSTNATRFVEWCVTDKAIMLKFPTPKGGGLVDVTYPMIFLPEGACPDGTTSSSSPERP